MSCQEIENRIPDYQENQLSPAQREEVETHLARCANCRLFARHLRELDAALSSSVKTPALSADFDRRLQERIRAESTAMSEPRRAERKRQLQAEFEAGAAQIVRGSFALGSLLRHLTWPALAIVAGWLAWRFTAQWTVHLHAESLGGLAPTLLPWLVASAVFVTICLTEAFPRPSRAIGV